MIKNYLKIAWRNLKKHRVDSAISIGGLALGIACCILLALYVRFEWSFDDFHTQSDRIFRVVSKHRDSSGDIHFYTASPYQLGSELKKSYPGLDKVIRLQKKQIKLKRKDELVNQEALFAGPAFFDVFSFKLKHGAPGTALSKPDDIVLTESKARQLFGSTDVVGKTVSLRLSDELRLYKISGIAADPPANSSIQFKLVLAYENVVYTLSGILRKILPSRWDVGMGETFVLLKQHTDKTTLVSKFPPFVRAHYEKDAKGRSLLLQPLKGIYFSTEYSSQITKSSSPVYSWILSGIALIVLIIACINFMSLTLSRSSARANEVGIRKTAGAQRVQLGAQFLGESFITCTIAFILGIALAELTLPYFRSLVGKSIPYHLFTSPGLWFLLGGIVLASALLTGLYPAVVMSRKKVTDSLKDNRTAKQIPHFVKGLIIVQFTLSLAFVIAAFIMHKQMHFINTKDLGFNKENIITIKTGVNTSEGRKIYKVYGQEIRRLPGVKNVASTFRGYGNALLPARLQIKENKILKAGIDVIDADFLKTLGIKIVEGRGFSDSRPADLQHGVLVNQTFVKSMGWQHPVGKEIPQPEEKDDGSAQTTFLKDKKVIGVVRDYNYRSLYNSLKPLVLVSNESLGSGVGAIWVRIEGTRISKTLAGLKSTWEKVAPGKSFRYDFLDDVIQQQYKDEQRWRRIVDISSLFAIGLACFGLFGLALLATQKRAKEIGIRKVFGATVTNIIGLLSKDFIKLVIVGFVIAAPIAWYAMQQWLADFAYKTTIGPGIFLLAGGLTLLIALATVSWQSIRAALANPVDSLRSE